MSLAGQSISENTRMAGYENRAIVG